MLPCGSPAGHPYAQRHTGRRYRVRPRQRVRDAVPIELGLAGLWFPPRSEQGSRDAHQQRTAPPVISCAHHASSLQGCRCTRPREASCMRAPQRTEGRVQNITDVPHSALHSKAESPRAAANTGVPLVNVCQAAQALAKAQAPVTCAKELFAVPAAPLGRCYGEPCSLI